MSYSTVSGFFLQDDPASIPSVIGALPARLGLLDDSPDRWTTFKSKVAQLNALSKALSSGEVYKVIFLCRHGQGFHNIGKLKYGAEVWDTYKSRTNGDNEWLWGPDALLTSVGEDQAVAARDAWMAELPYGIPLPERCYSSPLRRALDTWTITFAGGRDSDSEAVLPEEQRKMTILENCRETCRRHPCDRRSPLSELKPVYSLPMYTFEPGFAEEDLVWHKDVGETEADILRRARAVLDTVFRDEATFVSITTHGGLLNGILSVAGRLPYSLPTGGILPIVVKYTPGL